MEKNKILFERNLSGSYMKIIVENEDAFEERMLQKQKLRGLLPLEKCYIDGEGQYWYNISGKQSLDTFCKISSMGITFLEKLIYSICDALEVLSQHLMGQDSLCLYPEQIFISNSTEEYWFTVIPGGCEEIEVAFRTLIEYLLMQIDHKDAEAVQLAYDIYEKTLDEGYQLIDIQSSIVQAHLNQENGKGTTEMAVTKEPEMLWPISDEAKIEKKRKKSNGNRHLLFQKMLEIWGKWKKKITSDSILARQEWQVVYPEQELPEVESEVLHNQIHPTVCLSDYREHPEGLLLYEGYEKFANIRLEKASVKIGKGEGIDIQIAKNTISHLHARIEYRDKEYYLEDLNSTNGTFVNSKQLSYKETLQLKTNDIVCFADVKYRFV